ncbi:unnamed protein product, partial [Thlaspi arvense]
MLLLFKHFLPNNVMAKTSPFFPPASLLLVSAVIFQLSAVTSAICINYGTLGNLPPPQQVVEFIKTKTIIDAVKIMNANPDILQALAGTGIDVTIIVPNNRISGMVQVEDSLQWVAANVLPFHQQAKIKYICVGNEIILSNDDNLKSSLLPAMQSLNDALKASGLMDIKVTTPHAFTVDFNINAPSKSKFTDDQRDFYANILMFNRQNKSPFMINPDTYFMTDASNVTQYLVPIDATYSAMNALGYGDVDIAVGETGWPSCTPQNAANYNLNIIKRAQNIGTPLMPNRHIDIFIFALFNEDGAVQTGSVYDVGVLRGGSGTQNNNGILMLLLFKRFLRNKFMAKSSPFFPPASLLLVSAVFFQLSAVTSAIGINYGTLGNLPPPQQVIEFINTKTIIDAVKIFDANPDILQALAGTGIDITIIVPNDRILGTVQVENSLQWVASNVLPFHQQAKIKYICVGNEIILSNDDNLKSSLLPAIQSLNDALKASGLMDMMVTTPHAFTVDFNINAPSKSKFTDDQRDFYANILMFNRQNKSPFMINPYTYFMTDASNVNYAIFGSSLAITDANSNHTYTNMFDTTMDATYSAINALGYGDVDIAIGETGWPSVGEASWCTPQNAANYNLNIIKRAQNICTPLMPNRHIGIFIFALFNEDGKPTLSGKNWGLFRPDFMPVYDVGVLRGGGGTQSNTGMY